MKEQVLAALQQRPGRPNAITGESLAYMFNHKSDRSIRLAIRELIKDGWPVASSTEAQAGYFIVTSYAEARQYADSIKSRLIEDAIRRRDFRRAADMHLQKLEQGRLI